MPFGLGMMLGLGHNVAASGGGGGSATPFSALGISTFGWYTADDAATVNTGSSSVWTAKSGNAGALTQATAANRGTYSGSGTTSKLTFDTTDELAIASAPTVDWDAVAVITSNSSSATWRTLFWNASGVHALMLETGSNRLGAFNVGSFQDSGLTLATGTKAIVHVRATNNSGNVNLSFSLNGGTLTGTITSVGSGTTTLATIGNASGGGQAVGDIHAIAISNGALWSAGDLDKAVGCLAWEWGLQGSLPPGHTYKNAAP
jgi:hypothetical protein